VLLDIVLVLLGIGLSGVVFYFALQSRREVEADTAQSSASEAQRIVEEAKTKSELLVKEGELKI
jgi:type II secretory pathway pseudopilin PulG